MHHNDYTRARRDCDTFIKQLTLADADLIFKEEEFEDPSDEAEVLEVKSFAALLQPAGARWNIYASPTRLGAGATEESECREGWTLERACSDSEYASSDGEDEEDEVFFFDALDCPDFSHTVG